jgi:hypothetical protein
MPAHPVHARILGAGASAANAKMLAIRRAYHPEGWRSTARDLARKFGYRKVAGVQ